MYETDIVKVQAGDVVVRSRLARSGVLYTACLPATALTLLTIGGVVPRWCFLLVPITIGVAVLVARRCVLAIGPDAITYCNGLMIHRVPAQDVATVLVRRPAGFFGFYGKALAFASARYPETGPPIPLGPPALATLQLPHDQQLLVHEAMKNLLGETRTATLREWGP